VVWQDGSGNGFDIYGSIINSSGVASAPFAISNATADQTVPTVAWNASAGQYVVAWVDARTGGRVGYIHVPDMQVAGLVEFHRAFLWQASREALISVRDVMPARAAKAAADSGQNRSISVAGRAQ
jgi:hypothetical protein